ncbi:Uncharacterised protein [Shigella boydii]|uniref:Uncharacterized protein n=1 Tax=Shigella boydii TaxID=621 RepID=A0A2X2J3J0_SHIBO|nr:Uncharacterised protein [Shigella boydii]
MKKNIVYILSGYNMINGVSLQGTAGYEAHTEEGNVNVKKIAGIFKL